MEISGIDFVKRIDMLLKEKNKTRKELCESLSILQGTMATWKTKDIMPPIHTIYLIAKELNVSIDWLVTGRNYSEQDSGKKDNYVKSLILSQLDSLRIDIENYM